MSVLLHFLKFTRLCAYLVLAQKRKMKKDSKRGSVCCKDDDLRDTSVQSLCSLVGSLFQLSGMACLLHNVQQLLGQSRIGDGPSCKNISIRNPLSYIVGTDEGLGELRAYLQIRFVLLPF